jgi:hypothetical protein
VSDPAEQFFLLFAEESFAFVEFGGYFILSGCSMVLALLVAEYRAPKYIRHVVAACEFFFLFGLSLLLVRACIIFGLPFWSELTTVISKIALHSAHINSVIFLLIILSGVMLRFSI